MKLHELRPAVGATKKKKRIARGEGSTRGGTSTRGHNGAQSRAGYSRKFGFEGGQQPLQRRVPKFGFNNPNRIAYRTLNIDQLATLVEQNSATTLTIEDLISRGLLSKRQRIKVLGRGTLSTAVDIQAHAFSKTAQATIEQAGGKTRTI